MVECQLESIPIIRSFLWILTLWWYLEGARRAKWICVIKRVSTLAKIFGAVYGVEPREVLITLAKVFAAAYGIKPCVAEISSATIYGIKPCEPLRLRRKTIALPAAERIKPWEIVKVVIPSLTVSWRVAKPRGWCARNRVFKENALFMKGGICIGGSSSYWVDTKVIRSKEIPVLLSI